MHARGCFFAQSADAVDKFGELVVHHRRQISAVVEIGPGPHPAVAEASWRSAVAVDPLADAYLAEGLAPEDAEHVVIGICGRVDQQLHARRDLHIFCQLPAVKDFAGELVVESGPKRVAIGLAPVESDADEVSPAFALVPESGANRCL